MDQTIPERYRGKVVLGLNDVAAWLNEQSAQGYTYVGTIQDNGSIYVLVERDRISFATAEEVGFRETATRPPGWAF